MKLDPRNLRVSDALRLLNSTPLGEVVQPHVIYRHVQRAGFRIGDGKKIDLARYTAWLFSERDAPAPGIYMPAGASGGGGYAAHKEAVNAYGQESTRQAWAYFVMDVPDVPPLLRVTAGSADGLYNFALEN